MFDTNLLGDQAGARGRRFVGLRRLPFDTTTGGSASASASAGTIFLTRGAGKSGSSSNGATSSVGVR